MEKLQSIYESRLDKIQYIKILMRTMGTRRKISNDIFFCVATRVCDSISIELTEKNQPFDNDFFSFMLVIQNSSKKVLK